MILLFLEDCSYSNKVVNIVVWTSPTRTFEYKEEEELIIKSNPHRKLKLNWCVLSSCYRVFNELKCLFVFFLLEAQEKIHCSNWVSLYKGVDQSFSIFVVYTWTWTSAASQVKTDVLTPCWWETEAYMWMQDSALTFNLRLIQGVSLQGYWTAFLLEFIFLFIQL